MSTVDQFESVFKAAAKSTYDHKPFSIDQALVATDLEGAEANFFLQATKNFLSEAAGEAGAVVERYTAVRTVSRHL